MCRWSRAPDDYDLLPAHEELTASWRPQSEQKRTSTVPSGLSGAQRGAQPGQGQRWLPAGGTRSALPGEGTGEKGDPQGDSRGKGTKGRERARVYTTHQFPV